MFSGLIRVLLVLLSYCLSFQPFRCVFWLPYFSQKTFGFFGIRLLMFSCHLLPVVDRIFFHCFGMSCFVCIVLLFVDIFNLPSFASNFWSISSSFFLMFAFHIAFSFLFLHISAYFLCFIILTCFRIYFI